MIRNIIVIILIGFLMSCQNRSTDNKIQIPSKPDLNNLEIVVINIQGMTCTGCEETITKNVTSLGGIKACDVSHIEGIARIEFDTTVATLRSITNAIEKSGYVVADVTSINDTANIDN